MQMTEKPIRLAVVGGSSTGKTSFISRLTVDIVHEVHYPTRKQTNWLFTFTPHTDLARALLDEKSHERWLYQSNQIKVPYCIFTMPQIGDSILMSPLVYQSYIQEYSVLKKVLKHTSRYEKDGNVHTENQFYDYLEPCYDHVRRSSNLLRRPNLNFINPDQVYSANIKSSKQYLPSNYTPPSYTPISIDIIDMPGFKPEMIVPFLEVSLFASLDKDILKGLAHEPRRPVSTTSLLVASGAGELNGRIDGYIFVYSAVPELNRPDPPSYDDIVGDKLLKCSRKIPDDQTYSHAQDGGFSLLPVIRNCFLEAWQEFRDYQRRWDQGQEGDIYSLMYSMRQLWKSEYERKEKLKKLRSFNNKLSKLDLNPESPNSPPPMLIICTHCLDPLHSPVLIEWGKELATEWQSGFVALDSLYDYNTEIAMSMIIREIIEKDKLMKKKSSKKKGMLQKIVNG